MNSPVAQIAASKVHTTLRDALVATNSDTLRRGIHNQIKAAHRRKALEPVGLPFGVASLDGKNVTLEAWDDVQRRCSRDGFDDVHYEIMNDKTVIFISPKTNHAFWLEFMGE